MIQEPTLFSNLEPLKQQEPYPQTDYRGVLCIGDPHLEGRVPGFRKDDYPHVIVKKIEWCLKYAKQEKLLPAFLGDMFHVPRDNPNWLIVELLQVMKDEIVGIYGNHDVHENQINENDSLSILANANCISLLDNDQPFQATMSGRGVVIGATPWGQTFPQTIQFPADKNDQPPLVIWLTHHDMIVPGYDKGRINPSDGPKVDVVVNGHIHRRLDEVNVGNTLWLTPGNISRRTRSEATRNHVPAVLRIDVTTDSWKHSYVEIPHQPFDQVFHESIVDVQTDDSESASIKGLAELRARRTDSGAGLTQFLEQNLGQFEDDVATEIRKLAQEII